MTDDSTRPVGFLVDGFTPPRFPDAARIDGDSVRLERLRPDAHSATIFEAARGADWIWDYMYVGPFADQAAFTVMQSDLAAKTDTVAYAIIPAASGVAQGQATFMRIDPANGVLEIGNIVMTPPLQQTVASTEALMLMIGWAFDHGYRRVEWKCNALNAPSRRAALRLGFSYEGVFRQHLITKGRNRDTAWFAIIDTEWPALSAAYAEWLAPANFDANGRQRRSLSDLTGKALPGRTQPD